LVKKKNPIRIGIDLDNTIISYDRAFQIAAVEQRLVSDDHILDKKALREEVREGLDGELAWQKLQGYVYGKGINKAVLFPGVYRFLWRCQQCNIEVEVVSHKTEFGHFDPEKIPLREAATHFLSTNGLLDEKNPFIKKITYKDDRDAKINYIQQNNFDWFIDDLEEILSAPELEQQKGVLFKSKFSSVTNANKIIAQTWEEISQIILDNWELNEIKSLSKKLYDVVDINEIERLKGRGNSAIYKLELSNGDKSALKIYPQSSHHDRLRAEFTSTKIFDEIGLGQVQKPIAYNQDLCVATYEWIEGKEVIQYDTEEMKQMLSFLSTLHDNRTKLAFNEFPMAADAALNGVDIEKQIKRRLSQLNKATSKYIELSKFLRDEFNPILKEITSWSQVSWPDENSYTKTIERKEMTLSPSDCGFHNALISQSGQLTFHDFEYFGWDDPVKLISDFSHHAAMNLTQEMELLWFSGASEIYGKKLLDRLKAAWPLFGLNWCLIILNEFKDDAWSRRCSANDEKTDLRDEHLLIQLSKSRNKLHNLTEVYNNKYYW